MSFLKQRNYLVERSKASVRLEINRAIKLQNIPITHLVVDKDTPMNQTPYSSDCADQYITG